MSYGTHDMSADGSRMVGEAAPDDPIVVIDDQIYHLEDILDDAGAGGQLVMSDISVEVISPDGQLLGGIIEEDKRLPFIIRLPF